MRRHLRRVVIWQVPQPEELQVVQLPNVFSSPRILARHTAVGVAGQHPIQLGIQLVVQQLGPPRHQPLQRPIHRRQPTTHSVRDLGDRVPLRTHRPNPLVTRHELVTGQPPTSRIITITVLTVLAQTHCTARLFAIIITMPKSRARQLFPVFRFADQPLSGFSALSATQSSAQNPRSGARQAQTKGFLHSGLGKTTSASVRFGPPKLWTPVGALAPSRAWLALESSCGSVDLDRAHHERTPSGNVKNATKKRSVLPDRTSAFRRLCPSSTCPSPRLTKIQSDARDTHRFADIDAALDARQSAVTLPVVRRRRLRSREVRSSGAL